jgi:hypothetical protein
MAPVGMANLLVLASQIVLYTGCRHPIALVLWHEIVESASQTWSEGVLLARGE